MIWMIFNCEFLKVDEKIVSYDKCRYIIILHIMYLRIGDVYYTCYAML